MMNKKAIVKAIKQDLKSSVSYFDIFSVVNILVDELRQEIITKRQINIPNFGKFILRVFNPKIIKNVRNGELQLTKPYTALRFTISRNMLKQLINNGDL